MGCFLILQPDEQGRVTYSQWEEKQAEHATICRQDDREESERMS